MTPTDNISYLRTSSAEKHRMMDSVSVGNDLKNGRLTVHSYVSWLKMNNWLFHFNILRNDALNPFQQHIKEIRVAISNDLNYLLVRPNEDAGSVIINKEEHFVPILYMQIGSSMGARLILKFIQDNQLNLPTETLHVFSRQSSLFTKFISYVNALQHLDKEQLKTFNEDLWDQAFNILSKNTRMLN